MAKGVSASTIKSWFQYRCERKVRYELSSDEELAAIPVAKDIREQEWAILGVAFEKRVVQRLNRDVGVLQPSPGDFGLDEKLATAFLRGQGAKPYATQINLKTSRVPSFLAGSGLKLARTFPDLIHRSITGGNISFTVIDIKATRKATAFHKTQVAFYVRVLEERLKEIGHRAQIDPFGEVWRIPDDGTAEGELAFKDRFALGPYLRLVDEFCADTLPAIAAKRLDSGRDETFFHIYFKCEQCSFLEHCARSIDNSMPANRRDVSAVPGVTHEAKRALERLGIRSVAGLSTAIGLAQVPGVGWSLSRRAPVLVSRAEALSAETVTRTQDQHTFLMPARANAVLLISVDHDPVDDRLAAVGYRLVQDGIIKSEAIEVPVSGDLGDEADAIVKVLGRMILDLDLIDRANAAAKDGTGIYAHIFLYEPSEAVNLQRAIGRHLEDDRIRGGLLHLVRLFPPEEVIPEPEFRGVHHLPATAIRSVMEQLYNLPVAVSYDLRQVSGVLAASGAAGPAYTPDPDFQRPFSSLLSIDVIRLFKEGRNGAPTRERIVADVSARLDALSGIVSWLFGENARAAATGTPMLRLTKKPFRFQATFDPLNAVDLDVLVACEVLENRAGLLEALIGLAQPNRQRRDSGRSYANLTLKKHWSSGGNQLLAFSVPIESRQAELGPDDFNLILSDGSADQLLDPSNWGGIKCRILPPGEGFENRRDNILVAMNLSNFNAPSMQHLLRVTPTDGWFIDKVFHDANTAKATRFLTGLARVAA
jgi:hypothetical protein